MKIMNRSEFGAVLDSLVGKQFPLLSDGYVELIDAMGSDARIVQAARTTSDVAGKGDKDDANLIRYLLRHRHGTPFEFPHVCLKVVCPMDTWRQWIRHRTANVNEFSTRYSQPPDLADRTSPDKWRKQAVTNRQGSSNEVVSGFPDGYSVEQERGLEDDSIGYVIMHEGYVVGQMRENLPAGAYLSYRELRLQQMAREVYEERLTFGVAKEQARKDLPLSTYTTAYWQCDLRNLLGFLSLRMDAHAQWEIRQYANVIGNEIIAKLYPVTWQAFLDFDLDSMRLTALDQAVVRRLVNNAIVQSACSKQPGAGLPPFDVTAFMSAQHENWKGLEKCRERDECLAKLQELGLVRRDLD